ncbi:MAG TPA: hypothetical protein VM619_04085 [Luteimonas sp.]|nr:hypothetical protein [Luteimonas sp.]
MPTAERWARMTPEQKEAARQRRRRWKAANPDKRRAQWRRWYAATAATPEGRLRLNLRTRKADAKREGIPFAITLAEACPGGAPKVCPVLGLVLDYSGEHTDASPSFDRIDPAAGYVPGNVQVISLRANRIKRDHSPDRLRARLEGMDYGETTARGVTDDEVAQVLRYIEEAST